MNQFVGARAEGTGRTAASHAVDRGEVRHGFTPAANFAVDGSQGQHHNAITDHHDFINVMTNQLMKQAVSCINQGAAAAFSCIAKSTAVTTRVGVTGVFGDAPTVLAGQLSEQPERPVGLCLPAVGLSAVTPGHCLII
ncbi:hypothetical protein ACIQI8_41815 [Streptomyces sp. NPDC092369]|uniref:hypothetical protein n=1 Tax=Streptomyces sp. NPDC092369 TaxID=3366015 RepID=UPI00382A1B29